MAQIGTEFIDQMLEGRESSISRDLKLNLKRLLEEGQLAPEDALLTVLATSNSVVHPKLSRFARQQLETIGMPAELVTEAAESAAIMAMLNTYYRFRHMVGKEEDYRVASLRMNSLAKPNLGKQRFEMLAFAVSVLNGCESCIRSHEQALREHGLEPGKIHDLARIAAVVKALKALDEVN